MGHNISFRDYPEKTTISAITDDVLRIVSRSGDRYGTQSVKALPGICNSREEAESQLLLGSEFYGGYAIKFRDLDTIHETSKITDLRMKIAENAKKRQQYINAHSVKMLRAEFIGCKSCGSRLKKALLRGETCPLCKTDLRSETTQKRLAAYQEKTEKLNAEIRNEKIKQASKATIKWLVKFDYHS